MTHTSRTFPSARFAPTHDQSRSVTWLFVLAILLAQLLLAGCNSDSVPFLAGDSGNTATESYPTQAVPLSALELKQATDCEDLKAYIKKSLIKRFTSLPRYQYCALPVPAGGGATSGGAEAAAPAPATGDSVSGAVPKTSVPDGVSDTNNQEAGVNEGDIVKNDEAGNVYILSGRHLIIAKGFPPEELKNPLKEVDLGVNTRGMDLFLDRANSRLVVIAREETPYYITDPVPLAADAITMPIRAPEYTIAIFMDVSNPANPVVLEQMQFKGYYREGRRIDGRLHMVSNYYMRLDMLYNDPDFTALQSQFWSAVNNATACNEKSGVSNEELASDPAVLQAQANLSNKISNIIDAMNPEDYLPDALRDNAGTLEPINYLSCSDIHHPDVDMNLGLQIVASVDTDGANLSATGIVNNAWITYASTDNLYLADTSYNWWWTSASNEPPTSQTVIYKFAISADKPQYVATGRVDGYAKDQFSFSEYNGHLRVATTQNDSIFHYDAAGMPVWTRILNNHVFVLNDDTVGKLNIVGAVRDFAKDETLRSARFFGDKGFVVTFRSVDPLFAFDLSDPANPKMTGELTLPGFSTYIHAYDDNHIMTIGRAGGAGGTGTGNGLQLQLLDISDIAHPVLLHNFVPGSTSDIPGTDSGWSWSAAEYDHKAFTFYKPANLLAIPMMVTPGYSLPVFNGVVAFDVSLEKGFTELGKVDHADLAKAYYCDGTASLLLDYQGSCSDGWYVSWAAPRRTVVMTSGDMVYLYSISDVGMKASATNDLSTTLGSILFPPQPYPWWYFGPIGIAVGDVGAVSGGGVAVGVATTTSDSGVMF